MQAILLTADAATVRTPRLAVSHAEQYVYVALPCRPGEGEIDGDRGRLQIARPTGRGRYYVGVGHSSLLNYNFNRLWADALNRIDGGITHFAMQHSDIEPAFAWCDTFIDELAAHDADVMSAVVPLKDERGLTSTGIRCTQTGRVRRLTLAEVFTLPETFGLADLHAAGIHLGEHDVLVVNTGCWACRFTEPWVAPPDFPGFQSVDGILLTPDGFAQAAVLPEDWWFSEWAARRGLKVMATRKVALAHKDRFGAHRNDHVWGEWTSDQGDTGAARSAVLT